MAGSLIPMYRQMHRSHRGHFWGRSIRHHLDEIAALVIENGTETLLDYGCGKGHQYNLKQVHMQWGGIMPSLYDPAVAGIDKKPIGRFDGVICTDVLEHVPEDELDEVIADLVGYAKVWCFASIYCEPARKSLPNGRNVHVTIKPPEWWKTKLRAAFEGHAVVHLRFRP